MPDTAHVCVLVGVLVYATISIILLYTTKSLGASMPQ